MRKHLVDGGGPSSPCSAPAARRRRRPRSAATSWSPDPRPSSRSPRRSAQQFHSRNGQFPAPVVRSTGTGSGLEEFCAGTGGTHPDVVGASRRMRADEMQQCRAHGIANVAELQIGVDGVAFAQSPTAPPIRLTRRQAYEALAATPYGEPRPRRSWKEVNPAFRDFPILFYGPPAEDGTRDLLVEMIMLPGCESNPEMRRLRQQNEAEFTRICSTIRGDAAYAASGEDDERTATQLIVNPGAIGIFGYGYLEREGDRLRGIAFGWRRAECGDDPSGRYEGARPALPLRQAGPGRAHAGPQAVPRRICARDRARRLSRRPWPDPGVRKRAFADRAGGIHRWPRSIRPACLSETEKGDSHSDCPPVGAGTTRRVNSLRLLPSGSDRVGESAVRPTPARHMAARRSFALQDADQEARAATCTADRRRSPRSAVGRRRRSAGRR